MDYTYQDISKMIDHSLLNPTLSEQDLLSGITLAKAFDVASICILPYFLRRCTDLLAGTTIAPSTTIGFPHGGHTTAIKEAEAIRAVEDGCQELDLVSNISRVISGDWEYVKTDIKAVVDVAHGSGRKLKVIFENCYLNDEQKIRLCEICGELSVDWVKTSTGYGTGGATMKDLALMRKHSPEHVQVKAAGGVRDMDTLLQVRALGVSRVGASRTKEMLNDCRQRLGMEPIEVDASSAAGY